MHRNFSYLLESVFLILVILFFSIFYCSFVSAQAEWQELDVVSTFSVSDQSVEGGDIISYNPEEDLYAKSKRPNDENIFGVVVEDPLLVFNKDETAEVAVKRSGRAVVNVTTINGKIKEGDYITSSSWAGKGKKASKEEEYVLGLASAPLNSETGTATTTPEGEEVYAGQIPVNIGGAGADKAQSSSTVVVREEIFGFTVANTLPYILAAIIVFSSTVIAFKNFMPNIREGLASIGRNPMAKSSIQMMIIFNILLILAVVGAGFVFGLAVILLPI